MSYIMKAYDVALVNILNNGVRKVNRTGVDTIALFGIQSRYRIDERFPLLTGRKVWPKAIFGELLWFLSGSTNNNDLEALGSKIWRPWVDDEFTEAHGFVQGALGPVYGFQLRHFGGEYHNGDTSSPYYGRNGTDQLKQVTDLIQQSPDSRRILFDLWSPKDLSAMKLPPCHYTYQVFIHDGKLSGMLTQRSCDFPVGVPANIQFYSALTCMLAQQFGYEPYEFVHSTVDSHIYVDQIKAVEDYLARPKPDSPKLKLKKADDLLSYEVDSFEIIDYDPLSAIKVPVAV